MLFEDTYLTIQKPTEAIYKEKGSKFLAYAFPVLLEEEIKNHIAKIKKDHSSARHYCYAYRLGFDKLIFRSNDDGEPSNTAGKPILGQIQSKDLTNILIVVVRYFGGTLLGVGGLINAYKTATQNAIQNAEIIKKTVNDVYKITFDYLQMNSIMKIIKKHHLQIIDQKTELNHSIELSVRKSKSRMVYDLFKSEKLIKIKFIRTI